MANSRRYGLTPQLDINEILLEAQNRWLRPAEICEILRNYQNFRITPEPPNRPPSGSLFLFDRKVLRYFRKDGHNWRKKKDGKTVKEAHERLKAGSVDVLHCYYAHGEENENFQRRSYWMLEEAFMHIVLVHYLEKGNKASRLRDVEEIPRHVHDNAPLNSNSTANYNKLPSQTTEAESQSSAHASGYEDSDIADNYQASSRYHPFPEMSQFDGISMMDASLLNAYLPVLQNSEGNHQIQEVISSGHEFDNYTLAQEDIKMNSNERGLGMTFNRPRTQIGLASYDELLDHCNSSIQSYLPPPVTSTSTVNVESDQNKKMLMFSEVFADENGSERRDTAFLQAQANWQFADSDADYFLASNTRENSEVDEGNVKYTIIKQLSLDLPNAEGNENFKKHDSFSRWMNSELGEVDNSHMQQNSGNYFEVVERECVVNDSSLSQQDHLYPYVLSPSLSQDQLFSIIDFSPNWSYADLETKVLVTGKFLRGANDAERFKWSCMFGEVEVPAEVLANGILRCYAPPLKSGRVPFYITCSNRLACSEVREFEYLINHENFETYAGAKNEMLLHIRLEKLLTLGHTNQALLGSSSEKSLTCKQISSLLIGDDDWNHMIEKSIDKEFFPNTARNELLQKLLKEKLNAWLLCKVVENGKGPNILDKEGQGVIHLAAALGYDWAIAPTAIAGVNINFRDANGWSALHWAASCGRERTVVALVSLGADPGALTDPTIEFPSGRTPADLASINGHKGIAGFLAESSLTTHLSTLTLRELGLSESIAISHMVDIEETSERHAIQFDQRDMEAGLALKDSLCAVRTAAQAAARIYQVFRMHSFQRKELVGCDDTRFGMSDQHALSLLSIKANKASQLDEPVHAAAVRIQKKFRGWKGRKEFMVIRQRIVKIQAHIRGHQVRKHFRKVLWSVGVVEKVILRWRRKGCGLRGFRSEALIEGSTTPKQSVEEDYDFLREGRKQTEERLERALARVKSMVQYPDARDQYRRLLTGVEEFMESKAMLERILNDPEEEAVHGEMMFDYDELLGEDTPILST